ncbi:MAG: ABC transporter permease [Pseudomonadota bacterium]
MFAYHLRLAKQSLGKQPLLTALMIAAIAVGVGVCMTVTTFIYSVSSDPIPEKSDQLYTVRLDSWNPEEPFNDDRPDQAPWQMTHRDAIGILDSDVPVRQAAMRKAVYTIVPENDDTTPFMVVSRMTSGDFFGLFNVPFQYGGVWDDNADANAQNVVVIDKRTNDKLFGGENSVGQDIQFGDERFRITGVLAEWEPKVLYYDVNNGPLNSVEDVFMPFSITAEREINGSGNTNCWKDEIIDTYFDLLQSECIFVQFWAELPDEQTKAAYQDWLDQYTNAQRELGRFGRPNNNQLTNVNDWLELREVVSDGERAVWAIAVLFLIACLVNTIGLVLARFVAKAPVIGLRRALGASKLDIFRQHLVEVGLVGFIGGVIGLGLSYAGLIGVRKLLPDTAAVTSLNLELVFMTIVLAIVAAMAAGLYPTWRVCQLPPANYLKTQ